MDYFPFWKHLNDSEKEMIKSNIVSSVFEKGEVISSSEKNCSGMIFVQSGDVRVSIVSEDGRQITLYHILENELCVATASCVIKQLTFHTHITAQEHTKMLVIPSSILNVLAEQNIYVKAFMYELLTQRFSTVVWVMEQILCKRMDQRVADYLVSIYERTGQKIIYTTQEEIASEINSAREVVARILKQFSQDGMVELKRGKIILKNIDLLKNV